MDENEDEILRNYDLQEQFDSEASSFKSKTRRLEFLSVRALLCDMLGYIPFVEHESSGRPFLHNGKNISISHTKGYAVVVVSDRYNVAVDIEYTNDRVLRIAKRFLRADEDVSTVAEHQLCWCAKETLYKLHSNDNLSFTDMRTVGIKDRGDLRTGHFLIENVKRGKTVEISYMVTGAYILTFAFEKSESPAPRCGPTQSCAASPD